MLFRSLVSRQAPGKGQAVLEEVGLLSEVIDIYYVEHPRSEEAVQAFTGEYLHVDYVGLNVSESHPFQPKKEDTMNCLRN